ncbi:putative integral membrane protein [Tribonema minus]|uniref:Putative integral membrane protein n=1 Tax=Tribonema minus TaxID=303371 RepID=A0A835ZCA8_9STRA|nr:putative integral membrane protein [Tribonema minus]
MVAALDTLTATFSWRSSGVPKVPSVITIWFWVIKILCTTVGESCADWLNENLGLGLANTAYVMSAVFVVAFLVQFFATRYIALLYWLVVVLISTTGTLITDNLTDNVGVEGWVCVVVFSGLLAVSFLAWYLVEGTLSIHSIYTHRREFFYWLVVLFTFALGTAAGDLIAEKLGLGYWETLLVFVAIIAAIAVAYFALKVNAVLAFWLTYIMSRPLGASLGDLLASPKDEGGAGLGPGVTSAIFLSVILVVVVFLSVTKKDVDGTSAKPVMPDHAAAAEAQAPIATQSRVGV